MRSATPRRPPRTGPSRSRPSTPLSSTPSMTRCTPRSTPRRSRWRRPQRTTRWRRWTSASSPTARRTTTWWTTTRRRVRGGEAVLREAGLPSTLLSSRSLLRRVGSGRLLPEGLVASRSGRCSPSSPSPSLDTPPEDAADDEAPVTAAPVEKVALVVVESDDDEPLGARGAQRGGEVAAHELAARGSTGAARRRPSPRPGAAGLLPHRSCRRATRSRTSMKTPARASARRRPTAASPPSASSPSSADAEVAGQVARPRPPARQEASRAGAPLAPQQSEFTSSFGAHRARGGRCQRVCRSRPRMTELHKTTEQHAPLFRLIDPELSRSWPRRTARRPRGRRRSPACQTA